MTVQDVRKLIAGPGVYIFFFFSSRRRHTISLCDWSSDVCSSDLYGGELIRGCLAAAAHHGRLTFIGETRRDPVLEAALVEEFLTEQVTDFVFATVYPREVPVP